MGITLIEDHIFRKSNDYVSYIHGYYYVDIVTSSFLNDYTIKSDMNKGVPTFRKVPITLDLVET